MVSESIKFPVALILVSFFLTQSPQTTQSPSSPLEPKLLNPPCLSSSNDARASLLALTSLIIIPIPPLPLPPTLQVIPPLARAPYSHLLVIKTPIPPLPPLPLPLTPGTLALMAHSTTAPRRARTPFSASDEVVTTTTTTIVR